MGGGGGKGVGATWPDTVKQSGAGGTLTPADRHGSVQVSLPAHLPSFLSRHSVDFPEASPFFSTFFASSRSLICNRFNCNRETKEIFRCDVETHTLNLC